MARTRRHLGTAVVVLLLLAAAVLGTGTAATAATLTAPTTEIAAGDRSVTLAWAKVAGATGYRVQYSTSSAFARPVTVDAGTASWYQVKGLANGTRYYARVVAVAGTSTAPSAVRSAVPDDGYPAQLTVTAAPAGTDRIRVSWTGQGRATKVGVLAAADPGLTKLLFRSAWYPPTTTSVVLTVPADRRAQLGTGSGNPLYVRVATYNSATAGAAMPTVRDYDAHYRLSLAGPYTWAGSATPSGTTLRVATYNVKTVTTSAKYPGYTWKDRRTEVAAAIARSKAALVGTQELVTSDAGLGTGLSQWQDLRGLLARPGYGGYAIANTVTKETTGGNSNWMLGTHLFYKPGVLTREAGGFVSPRRQLGISWPAGLADRYLTWARFRVDATGARFYAVDVHLPVDVGGTDYEALRKAEAAAVDRYVSAMAGSLPVVFLGDLNSNLTRTTYGPAQVLRDRGYYDAAAAPTRYNTHYYTTNTTHQVDNLAVPGFPTRPYRAKWVASRIDHIMTKHAPGSRKYSNQLVLVDGAFDRAYQGSDHNLQWAEVGIR